MEISSKFEDNLNSLCRTCLKYLKDEQKYDIFLSRIGKWLTICTSLEVDKSDNYPKNLCKKCYKKIEKFYEFREMCLKSVQKFDEIRSECAQHLVQDLKQLDQGQQNTTLLQYDNEELVQKEMKNLNPIVLLETEVNNEEECKNIEELVKNEDKFIKLEDQDISVEENNYFDCNEENKFVTTNSDDNDDDDNDDDDGDDDDDTDYKLEKNIDGGNNKEFQENNNSQKKAKNEKSKNQFFTCDICEKRFLKEDKYEAHKKIHLGLKPWNCTQCDKQYIKRWSLIYHIRYHHDKCKDDEQFVCPIENCGKKYVLKGSLRAHIKSIHEAANKVKEKKSFICEDCGASTTSLPGLRRHRLSHASELPFKCEICSKQYRTKYKLKEHINRHKGIKNFVCSICGLKKVSQHELNVHMNYHTRKKLHNCSLCEYSSGNITTVKRHEKVVHHGIKPYICKHCGNGFGKAGTLKHHEMTHTGEKPHKCPKCSKRFIQLSAMKVHLKRHEKNRV